MNSPGLKQNKTKQSKTEDWRGRGKITISERDLGIRNVGKKTN